MNCLISNFVLLWYCLINVKSEGFCKSEPHQTDNSRNAIIIELQSNTLNDKDSITIPFLFAESIGENKWGEAKSIPDKFGTRWSINTGTPVYLSIKPAINKKNGNWFLGEPGDNVKISFDGKRLQFSGKGADKFRLQYLIDSIMATIPKPENPRDYSTVSLNDYFQWHRYLNKHIDAIIPLIESHKYKLSDYAYNTIKGGFLSQNMDDRSDKFGSLRSYARTAGISVKDICAIYDSTYNPSTEKWFSTASKYYYVSWRPLMNSILRKYSFDFDKEPLSSTLARHKLYLEEGKKAYKGLQWEKFFADVLVEKFIDELGFIPETDSLLAQYYSQPDYPEYKKYVRDYELRTRERRNGRNAPDFILKNANGDPFTKENLKGKVAVLDFWFTGCVGCVQMTPALHKVEQFFKDDTNIVFLNISVDKDKNQWLKSIEQKRFTTGSGINLYTGGKGTDHDIIRTYGIDGYPTIWLMDAYGRIIKTSETPDPRHDNGKRLIELLKKQLAYAKDGPYLLYDDNNVMALSINGENVHKEYNIDSLRVRTDQNTTFQVFPIKSAKSEPSEFRQPQKLLALSDIEGNFEAFRKLLQANKIIDDNYNWTFGEGHLVFAGDMFDRGPQVTECLWLIYSLEEKAKKAGGYVHFILGNHEIMNLYGDHRYAQVKYINNSKLIGITLKDLYNKNSELGRWLRTKNIIEKIGDLLFAHAGISKEFSDSIGLTISGVNDLARRYLGEKIEPGYPDKDVRLIHSSDYSPFWFRQYYKESDKTLMLKTDTTVKWRIEKPDENEMLQILNRWQVSRIITGHTIVADTISSHYEGKVINLDTDHASGKSEALLIEGSDYYRVNSEGQRVRLFFTPTNGTVIR